MIRAWAEINLSNLTHNLTNLRKHLKNARLMGIVKADAYGHGAVPVARTLLEGGADTLGVAICEEGMTLRENNISAPILVMGFTPEQLLHEAVRLNLAQTVFSPDGAKQLAAQASRLSKKATVHIKIDTGMSRLGFLPTAESVKQICEIAQNPNLFIEGIFTHLATAGNIETGFMYEQLARFKWMIGELEKWGLNIPVKHISNSGAFAHMCSNPGINDFAMDTVRLGIMLYGYPPSAEMADTCAPLDLKPVMRLMSRVCMVKELDENVGVSYGHIFKTTRKTKIAVLSIGYADGYPRLLSRGGRVLIGGNFAPVAGTICMDQCMADITDIPNVKVGDPVTMMGEKGVCADSLAETAGTISYEILCGIGKRVPRTYV